MKYTVAYQQPTSHLLQLTLEIPNVSGEWLELQLPAWRPGRYELQNFAKNIFTFEATDGGGEPILFEKLTKDRWRLHTGGVPTVRVHYTYYAAQMDAGGSWLDEEQLYINWVNCALMVVGREEEAHEVHLQVPDNYQVASALRSEGHTLYAQNFFELIDSPTIASAGLQHFTYSVGKSRFHLWLQGQAQLDWDKALQQFEAFTRAQIAAFGGDFPCEEYHFMYQILPYRHYHGVEHSHSTVIVLGPSEELSGSLYDDFLGVSSHELYHTWNTTRLRPIEMVPYRLEGENYFQTGFVAEGVTTYYGDLLLKRSGVWEKKAYLKEIDVLFKRHFENFARYTATLTGSSFDLWLDGYQTRFPKRTVSIYVKGALVALVLDLLIRKETQNQHSLDDVMRDMWELHGKSLTGYSLNNYRQVVGKYLHEVIANSYFEACISGTDLLEDFWLPTALQYVGLALEEKPSDKVEERDYGFRMSGGRVQLMDPSAQAYSLLEIGDEILAINGKKADNVQALLKGTEEAEFTFFRHNILRSVRLKKGERAFFRNYQLAILPDATEAQAKNLAYWLGES